MRWQVGEQPRVERRPDSELRTWTLESADAECELKVELTGSALSMEPAVAPSPLDEALRSRGRSVIDWYLREWEPPGHVLVTSNGLQVIDGSERLRAGEPVWVRRRPDGDRERAEFAR